MAVRWQSDTKSCSSSTRSIDLHTRHNLSVLPRWTPSAQRPVSSRRPWHPVLNLLMRLPFDAHLTTDRSSDQVHTQAALSCITSKAAVLNICKVLKCMLMLSPVYNRCNVKTVKKLLLSQMTMQKIWILLPTVFDCCLIKAKPSCIANLRSMMITQNLLPEQNLQ